LQTCHDKIWGILLFPSPLTEGPDYIYPFSTNMPVEYASNDMNATANAMRSSMNPVESRKLANGYKFVYGFTDSHGNGTIATVGLQVPWAVSCQNRQNKTFLQ